MHRRGKIVLLLALGFVFGSVERTSAQVDTGTILGTVNDQAGAAIPGAKVTLTNEGTGVSASMLSRADGSYIFTPVRVGSCTVAAEFTGFEVSRRLHVSVNIQQQVVVDFSLHPGEVTTTVEVTDAPALP